VKLAECIANLMMAELTELSLNRLCDLGFKVFRLNVAKLGGYYRIVAIDFDKMIIVVDEIK